MILSIVQLQDNAMHRQVTESYQFIKKNCVETRVQL